MRSVRKTTILIIATAALAACGVTIRAGADFDENLDLQQVETFGWGEADALPTGDPRLDNNPFFNDRLHAAIQDELAWRGIRLDENAPDLLVHHHTSVRSRVEVFDVDRRAGYESPEYGSGTEVFEYEEGTFLVDIADAKTKEILWRGWAQADIEAALTNPDQMNELVENALEEMFVAFPLGAASSR